LAINTLQYDARYTQRQKMSVNNYQSTPRIIPEQRGSQGPYLIPASAINIKRERERERERKKMLNTGVMTQQLPGEGSRISARNTALLSQ
jgi:hypothetical protein